MKFLFFAGLVGVLGGLTLGLISGDYLLGIMVSVTGIGMILFSLPFLMVPFPVYVVNPIPLNFQMTVRHKCDEPDEFGKLTRSEEEKGEEDPDKKDDEDPPNPDWGDVPGKPFEG